MVLHYIAKTIVDIMTLRETEVKGKREVVFGGGNGKYMRNVFEIIKSNHTPLANGVLSIKKTLRHNDKFCD